MKDRLCQIFSACGGTVDVTHYSARLGTTYLDAGPVETPGSVTEYDRPKDISSHPNAASGMAIRGMVLRL